MGFGGLSFLLGTFNLYAQDKIFSAWATGRPSCDWALVDRPPARRREQVCCPSVSPAYIGVGYVIDPNPPLNVAGSVLPGTVGSAADLLLALIFKNTPAAGGDLAWDGIATSAVFVRPIASAEDGKRCLHVVSCARVWCWPCQAFAELRESGRRSIHRTIGTL